MIEIDLKNDELWCDNVENDLREVKVIVLCR